MLFIDFLLSVCFGLTKYDDVDLFIYIVVLIIGKAFFVCQRSGSEWKIDRIFF